MYTVKLAERSQNLEAIAHMLGVHVLYTGIFNAELRCLKDERTIEVPRVRLKTPKPYFGMGPNAESRPRPANFKPKRMTILGWYDWITFNNVINDALDECRLAADVWSKPQATRDKFYIRRGHKRRASYRVDTEWVDTRYGGHETENWNCKSEAAFEEQREQ
jgi:hypothetical protein